MGKRRLSQQQRQRIRARQITRVDDDNVHPGLVLANVGKGVLVEAANGDAMTCHVRQHLPVLVPGDNVGWCQPTPEQLPVVVAVEPRHSELLRYAHTGLAKPIASNLNQIMIVLAPNPTPFWHVIDSYIVLAHCLGLRPVLVLNKVDRLPAGVVQMDTGANTAGVRFAEGADAMRGAESVNVLVHHMRVYQQLGYSVLATSTVSGVGMSLFEQTIAGHVSCLVGQSGVGKSALAAQLLPGLTIKIADDEVTTEARLGKHTTTTARLYHCPGGGDLIDCPGVRVLHATGLSHADIQFGFKDIASAARSCRFGDCKHLQPGGCAVLAAVACGAIDARRFASYQQMCEGAT